MKQVISNQHLKTRFLENQSNSEILKTRICDLKLSLEGTVIPAAIKSLNKELDDTGFVFFRPQVYLGDEWFSPEGSNLISIPFFLTNSRLINLERSIMSQVEGETKAWSERLLRHETGHCFDHAYKIAETFEWKTIFGNPNKKYTPDNYTINRNSKDFVINLEDNYAQSHPYEDFAETFAVWLNPKSNWRKRYEKSPVALKKLKFVQDQVRKFSKKKPTPSFHKKLSSTKNLRCTVQQYYDRRIREAGSSRII